MDTVIFCNNHDPIPHALSMGNELSLLPILNAPLAQRMVETAKEAEQERVILVADSAPSKMREILGSGKRWDIAIEVLTPMQTVKATLGFVKNLSSPFILLTSAALLFTEDIKRLIDLQTDGPAGLSCTNGMAAYRLASADDLPASFTFETAQSRTHSLTMQAEMIHPNHPCSMIRDIPSLHAANMQATNGFFQWLTREENESSANVFIGHHCDIHPSATINAPVMIGHHSTIAAKAVVGPNAVIGAHCIVDEEAEVTRSVLAAGTYAGPLTSRDGSFSYGQMLVKVENGACLMVPDTFLQGDVAPPHATGFHRVLRRAAGWLLAIGLSPLLVLVWIMSGFRFRKWDAAGMRVAGGLDCDISHEKLKLHKGSTSSVLLNHLPAVLDVAAGRLSLVGPEPLTLEDAQSLVFEWNLMRFETEPGFIPPWLGTPGPLDPEERHAASALYARQAGLKEDWRVFCGSLRHGWSHRE